MGHCNRSRCCSLVPSGERRAASKRFLGQRMRHTPRPSPSKQKNRGAWWAYLAAIYLGSRLRINLPHCLGSHFAVTAYVQQEVQDAASTAVTRSGPLVLACVPFQGESCLAVSIYYGTHGWRIGGATASTAHLSPHRYNKLVLLQHITGVPGLVFDYRWRRQGTTTRPRSRRAYAERHSSEA